MSKLAQFVFLLLTLAVFVRTCPAQTPLTLEEMKGEADRATGGHQARLCAELAAHLVDEAGQEFTRGNVQQAQARIQDVLAYATKAHAVSLNPKTGAHDIKETELALRKAERSLEELKRTLALVDRPPLDTVEKKLDGFRQDLLNILFAPKRKEKSSEKQ